MMTPLRMAVALAIGLLANGQAGESVFQEGVNGYVGTFDTEIVQGQPDAEGSKTSSLNPDGSDRGGVVQVLMRFDNIVGEGSNQVPTGKEVFAARLTLNVTGPGTPLDFHRMLIPWEDTVTWATIDEIGDGVTPDDATAAVDADVLAVPMPATVIEVELPVSTVQSWVDGSAENYGWVMIPTGTDGVDFSSSETATPTNRPKLTVVWGEPGQPFVNRSVGTPQGIVFEILDGSGAAGTDVLSDSVSLVFDGVEVTVDVTKNGDATTVSYDAPDLLPSNSEHSYTLSFSDNAGNEQSEVGTFAVPFYSTIPSVFKVDEADVDKADAGFNVKLHQQEIGRPTGNNLPSPVQQARGELLDPDFGEPYENLIDVSWPDEDGNWVDNPSFVDPQIYLEAGVINYNQDARDNVDASAGNFGPDNPLPGIPGLTDSTDNIAMEATAFLELEAGLYRMGVNSDDGFVVSSSLDPRDAFAAELGAFNGGRGSADTFFNFVVEEAGIYPFALYWWEGGGGANVEWFTEDLATGEQTLVNGAGDDAVKAYRTGPVAGSYASSIAPMAGEEDVPGDTSIEIVLEDGEGSVDQGSVKLIVNGEEVAADVSKMGSTTTISYSPATDFEPSTNVHVRVEFNDGIDNVREYSFRVQSSGFFTFQEGVNGYTGTFDTEIVQGQPDAEGSETAVLNPDGSDRGGVVQVLIRFDNLFGTGDGQIPPGEVIESAKLNLNITGAGTDLTLHRMLQPWEETVTWFDISADPLDPQGATADDVIAAAIPDTGFSAPARRVTVDIPASTIQSWLNGDVENNGWVMIPTGTDGVDFDSSEASEPSNRPELVITLSPWPPVYEGTVETVQVSDGNDDSEEHITEGNSIDIGSSDLELGAEGGGGDIQEIGVRFQGVNVPAGATITGARIQFTVDEADDEPTSLLFYGELTPDAAAFTETVGDITARIKTEAVVEWNDIPVWDSESVGAAGRDQSSPDLAAIVQELVDQDGWAAGNAMSFIISANPGGERTVESYNGSANQAPQLIIGYTGGGDAPVVPPAGGQPGPLTITADANGVTVEFEGTLQSADVVSGPYSNVDGATSPATFPAEGTAKFYRSVQ